MASIAGSVVLMLPLAGLYGESERYEEGDMCCGQYDGG